MVKKNEKSDGEGGECRRGMPVSSSMREHFRTVMLTFIKVWVTGLRTVNSGNTHISILHQK